MSRMASGAFWSFTGTALAKFIVLVAGIWCARILGQEEYGELGMIRSTINMFAVFGFAGLGLTATKYISEYKKDKKGRISSIYMLTNGFALCMGILVTLVILLAAPYLAEKTLKSPDLVNDIRFGAILLFVTVINGAQNGTLAGLEDFKSIALNMLKGSIAETLFMILGAYYWGVTGAILGYGCGFMVIYIGNQISIQKKFRELGIVIQKSSFCKSDLKLLYKFSLPAALSSIMVSPVFWIIRSMLVRKDGFEELAIFEAADQWRVIILFIPVTVSQVVLPILSSMSVNKRDKTKFWRVLKMNLCINVIIALTMALIISLLQNNIMGFYGKEYTDTSVLVVLAFSTIFTAIANVVGLSISSQAKMWVGFIFNALWGIILISLTYYFLSCELGALGIAWAILISYSIHIVLQLVYLKYNN